MIRCVKRTRRSEPCAGRTTSESIRKSPHVGRHVLCLRGACVPYVQITMPTFLLKSSRRFRFGKKKQKSCTNGVETPVLKAFAERARRASVRPVFTHFFWRTIAIQQHIIQCIGVYRFILYLLLLLLLLLADKRPTRFTTRVYSDNRWRIRVNLDCVAKKNKKKILKRTEEYLFDCPRPSTTMTTNTNWTLT